MARYGGSYRIPPYAAATMIGFRPRVKDLNVARAVTSPDAIFAVFEDGDIASYSCPSARFFPQHTVHHERPLTSDTRYSWSLERTKTSSSRKIVQPSLCQNTMPGASSCMGDTGRAAYHPYGGRVLRPLPCAADKRSQGFIPAHAVPQIRACNILLLRHRASMRQQFSSV